MLHLPFQRISEGEMLKASDLKTEEPACLLPFNDADLKHPGVEAR